MGAGGGVDGMVAKAREIGGVKVLSIRADVGDAGAMREMAEKLREKLGDSIVVVGAPSGGKAALVVMVSKPVTSRAKAGEIIRPIAQMVGGAGGGRPDMAQAGGSDVSKLDEAIEAAYGVIEKILIKA
jgi:alanyl-tRNA synthetase